ncbi:MULTISPECIES: sugar MFS transporter [unclassified Clostridium]|uniref:MFS transporter n=1 Tax=unclassified Clostridium TaxID=2614128 RepID=UPI001C8C8A35|nr:MULTISPECIES: MFS transporter [unclassified Clostridium]MBX9138084.1 MFS transporter [Clostridium sp. K12(2020)]MBX9142825.1 MFS transporter [Clostridium sp. K13]
MFNLLLAVIYLAFISLGLPDSLLGSVWPTMYQEFNVPVSYAGAIFMIISAGTIFSSLQSDRLTKSFGTGKVTAFSVLMTAIALWGFSISSSYWMLISLAIPYGLGAGSVDASLNNYVALHYKSHHMSWLHCMWGIGASIGPYIMSFALVNGQTWNMGYLYISLIQVALTVIIMLSLPLWKKPFIINDIQEVDVGNEKNKALTLKEIVNIPGAKQVMIMFFCYCALEQTAGLWASSYLVLQHGFDLEVATSYGSLFFIGITVGRAISGFITMKLKDKEMIYLGQGIILIGIIIMCLPLGHQVSLIGLVTIGLGCAPIYPCIIHSTPTNFGKNKSQAVIGVQMASAYVGNLLMPPLFGIIANHISVIVFPIYLLLILIIMVVMHIKLNKSVSQNILIN